uniref:Uncharacterized protein LOC111122165 n=1 Tax=Crassostrea virginica TaxID=6565 RepID=A0A8B8CUE2_CRAVI|nr:uncharacterized protein LOC111122165 [Crassostrea virginica]
MEIEEKHLNNEYFDICDDHCYSKGLKRSFLEDHQGQAEIYSSCPSDSDNESYDSSEEEEEQEGVLSGRRIVELGFLATKLDEGCSKCSSELKLYQQLSKCFSKDLIFCPLYEKVQSPYLQDKIQCFDTLTSLYRLRNPFGSLFSLRMQSLLIKLLIWEMIFSS